MTEHTERAVAARVPTLIDEGLSLVSRREPLTVRPGSSLRDCLAVIRRSGVGDSVVVTEADGRLVGILTERDIFGQLVGTGVDLDQPVETYMNTSPHTLRLDATVRDAIELMRQRDLSQLPVKRDGRLVGCISENQAIDLLFRRDDLATLRVEEVMGPPLPVLPADTPAEEIASMLSRGVKAVIVDKGRGELVVLTKFDLIHAGAR